MSENTVLLNTASYCQLHASVTKANLLVDWLLEHSELAEDGSSLHFDTSDLSEVMNILYRNKCENRVRELLCE